MQDNHISQLEVWKIVSKIPTMNFSANDLTSVDRKDCRDLRAA